jgi:hypothetical protein
LESINPGSEFLALVLTLVLMHSHYLSPLMRRLPGLGERGVASFAGGVAVAYVFLHMLPELVEGNANVGRLLAGVEPLTPLLDLGIFIVALTGFTVYYGLELVAVRAAEKALAAEGKVYALHLGMYCLYNFLITYTMPLRVQTGLIYALIFTGAMSLHFTLSDRNFKRHFPRRFSLGGRLILVGSLAAGWGAAALTELISVLAVSLMIAFLLGSILYNVFKEELPAERNSSYAGFTLGLGLTTALLALEAYLSHP